MADKKRFRILDTNGDEVNYDISSDNITIDDEDVTLTEKLAAVDNVPTSGSGNTVTSGGVYTAIEEKVSEVTVNAIPAGSIGIIADLVTDSDTDALSASMGVELDGRITDLENYAGGITYTEDSETIYVMSAGYTDTTPRISVTPTSATLSPGIGETVTKTFTVKGFYLTNSVVATLSDTSGYYSIDNSVLEKDGGTVILSYTPLAAGTHTASLIFSSGTDAEVTVGISGTASAPTISVDTDTLSLASESGSSATARFTVTGVSLMDVINVAVSGSGFSVSPTVITAASAAYGVDVVVTFDGSAASGTATITLSSTNATSVTVTANYAAVARLAEGDTIAYSNGGTNLLCTVLADTTKVSVADSSSSGALVIPSAVTDSNGLSYAVTALAYDAFYNNDNITSVVIPDSITETLGGSGGYSSYSRAFESCNGITSAVIGAGFTTMGKELFADCTSLASVTIKDGCSVIGDNAFKNCTALTELFFPNSVKTFGVSIFGGSGVKKVQFGTSSYSITSMIGSALCQYGGRAVSASSLEVIISYIASPPGIFTNISYGGGLPAGYRNYDSSDEADGSNIDTNGTGRLYVLADSVSAYQAHQGWGRMVGSADYSGDSSGRIYSIADIGTITGYESDSLIETEE